MRGAAILLLVALVQQQQIHVHAASYTVQLTSSGYDLSADSSSLSSGAATLSNNIYSLYSDNVQWYATEESVSSPSALPSTFQTISTTTYNTWVKMGPELYRMNVTDEKPDVVYFGGPSGSEWTCTQTVVAFHTGFSCSAASGSGTTVATLAAPTEGSLWTLTAEVSDAGAANSILSLMAVLASKLQVSKESLSATETQSSDRRSNGQSVTVGFFFVGSLVFLALLTLVIVCSMWLWQPLSKSAVEASPADPQLRFKMRLHNLGLHTAVPCLIVVIFVSVWRFPVLFLIVGFFLLYVILTSIVYACIQCCCSKDPPVAEPVTPALNGDPTTSPDSAAGEVNRPTIVQLEDTRGSGEDKAQGKASTVQTPTPTASTTPTPTSTGSDNASCFGWCDSRDSGSGRLCGSGSGSNVELPPDSMNATNDTVSATPSMIAADTCPHSLSWQPLRTAYIVAVICFFLFAIVELALFFGWSVKEYYVWDRNANQQENEYQPTIVAKALLLMYSFDSLATDLNYNVFCDITTNMCDKYRDSISDKSVIKDNWIDKYNIDMSQFSPADYNDYDSINAWFIRGLAAGARPISSTQPMVAAADGRLMVFTGVMESTRFWIKSNRVDVEEMLDSSADAAFFSGASMAIYRLAPQDYHRFHTPVAGTIISIKYVSGTTFSVSADAAQSKNAAFLNQRHVVMINSTDFGIVGYAAVGATCVGSTVITKSVGDTIAKGDELGYMQFGGSTVVVLFQAGTITFDADLTYNSGKRVETHVLMGEHNGMVA